VYIGFDVFVIYPSQNTSSLKMVTIGDRNMQENNSVYTVIYSCIFIRNCWLYSYSEASVHGNDICKIKYFKLYMMFHITFACLSITSHYNIYTALQQFVIYGKVIQFFSTIFYFKKYLLIHNLPVYN